MVTAQHAFVPGGEPPVDLVAGADGSESFATEVGRRAAELGVERPTSAILVYGVHYRPSGSPPAGSPMTFMGVYEYE